MAIFDYQCECGNETLDKLVRSSDAAVECDKCGAVMRKQVCVTKHILLMGEGFHKPHDQNKIKAAQAWN